MKGHGFRVGALVLIALAAASQGCFVSRRKYGDLKRRCAQMAAELELKDPLISQQWAAIARLRDRIKTRDQFIRLYEDEKAEAVELARRAKSELDEFQKRLDEIARIHPLEAGRGALRINDTVLFAHGSAEISEQGRKTLQDIAKEFKATDEIIQIDGHTDDLPVKEAVVVKRFGDNWGLSAMRARAVLLLLAKSGIPEERMYLRGFGMHRPRVSNTNDASRSRNRRVEVIFLPKRALEPNARTPPSAPKALPRRVAVDKR